MQDGKLHLTSICSLKNAKTRLYVGCNDEFEDIFQLLSPMEINNIEFLLDDTPLEATEFLESYVKLPAGENLEITKVDSVVDQVSLKKSKQRKLITQNGTSWIWATNDEIKMALLMHSKILITRHSLLVRLTF